MSKESVEKGQPMERDEAEPAQQDPTARREFLRLAGMSLMVVGAHPVLSSERLASTYSPSPRSMTSSTATKSSGESVLVVVFQRGAADALHTVVPYRDKRYKELRGALALDMKGDGLFDLGDGFGLHPAMAPLHASYKKGRLGALVNVGSPNPTRSHFDAQDYMETGTPGVKGTRVGWLSRLVASLAAEAAGRGTSLTPFTGVSLTSQLPRSFAGTQDAIAMADFSRMQRGSGSVAERIHAMYARDDNSSFSDAGHEASAAMKLFTKTDPLSLPVRAGVSYPRGRTAGAFRQLAQLIKSGLGIRVAFLESNGWDTHFAQGVKQGQMARLMSELAQSIAAFVDDVGDSVPMTLMTMTEFGRSARANGAGGTDHGHGGAAFAIGPNVVGGKVHGDWLGLGSSNLFDGRDLPVTTDFRDVFTEVASSSLGLEQDEGWFPDHRTGRVGLIR